MKTSYTLLKKIGLLLCIFSAFNAIESSASSTAAMADSAYVQKQYETAISLYNETLEKEGSSAALLYNMANCYYQLGKDGEARLLYERAARLDPGNPMITQNLNFLQSRVTDANKGALQGKAGNVEPDPETFMGDIYRMIAVDHTSNGWAVFAVMAFILFLGGLALYMFTPNVLARKTGFFSALVFIGFSVVFIVFAFLAAKQFNRQDEAVLMNFSTELLQSPDAKSAPSTSPLHKGTKLKILEAEERPDGGEWIKVKLNSENVGWVKKSDIEII